MPPHMVAAWYVDEIVAVPTRDGMQFPCSLRLDRWLCAVFRQSSRTSSKSVPLWEQSDDCNEPPRPSSVKDPPNCYTSDCAPLLQQTKPTVPPVPQLATDDMQLPEADVGESSPTSVLTLGDSTIAGHNAKPELPASYLSIGPPRRQNDLKRRYGLHTDDSRIALHDMQYHGFFSQW